MKKTARKCIALCMASVMAMLLPAQTAAAETTGAGMQDLNGDGVVDVFDLALAKRAAVIEYAPMNLNISDAEGVPGETVTVACSIEGNPGLTELKCVLKFPDTLQEVESPDVRPEPKLDKAHQISALLVGEEPMISCLLNRLEPIETDTTLFYVDFCIPDDAQPGTVYTLSYLDASAHCDTMLLPLLTTHGKITVLDPALTTTTTTTTTETTTTTTTTETTVPMETETTTTTVTTESATMLTTTMPETTTATTGTTGTTVPPYLHHGVDISAWQGNVDFKKLAADPSVEFAILRAGFGRYLKQEDPYFQTYYREAKANGIPVGAYWYSYATTPEEARIEANVCMQVLGDRTFEYPIAFDIEEPKVLNKKTPAEISAIIEAFCEELEKKNYYVSVYCSSYYLNNKIKPETLEKYDVWVAHYRVPKPTYTGKYGIWQYDVGTADGVVGDVDVNYCYVDYPSLIRELHKNGY